MAWEQTLLDCAFRGIPFDVIDTQDTADRATAEHAYPYVAGADIEDLGDGPHVVNLTAFFYGDSYEQDLQEFLAELDKPGSGTLTHPIFGQMHVQLRRRMVKHDAEHPDQCTVTLEFAESTPGNPFFYRNLPSQQVDAINQQGEVARSAAANALGNLVDTLRNSSPLATLNALRQSMLGPVLATLSQVHGVLLSGMDVLAFPRAWANDISAIVNGVLDQRDFGDALIADWQYSANVLGLFDVFTGGGNASVRRIHVGAAPSEAQAVAAVAAHLAASIAIGMANATALVLAAEADPQHGPTLSPPEIERVVNEARGRIDIAIVAIRTIHPLEVARTMTEPLKDQALALQEAARAIIEARPPLISRRIDAPGNLRLLAHRWYGDHRRALELWRLNPGLRLPNASQAGDLLNAFAR